MRILFASLLLFLACAPVQAAPSPGREAVEQLRVCIMQNDATLCRAMLTPSSHKLFERFYSYKLMPCLPTDFAYASEERKGDEVIVKSTLEAGGGKHYVFRLVLARGGSQWLVDVPRSLQVGLGEKWQNKIDMAESLFLMMRQSMDGTFTCDKVSTLVPR